MNTNIKRFLGLDLSGLCKLSIVLVTLMLSVACTKNDYYKDSGTIDPNYNGTILDYLNNNHGNFDSVSRIVKLANMENVFKTQSLTFFAPSDSCVRLSLQLWNSYLASFGMQPITRMDQIDSSVWRKYISLYLFAGAKSMNDYRQVDWSNFSAFSGQSYPSYGGYSMNIGVVYNDIGGIQYAGYRQLVLSYIGSQTNPKDITSWRSTYVISANIHPSNGYVHALEYLSIIDVFGFSESNFILVAIRAGIKY